MGWKAPRLFRWMSKTPVDGNQRMPSSATTPETLIDWAGRILITPHGTARTTASTWPTLHRCVHLVSVAGAALICDAVRVVDRNRNVVKTPAAMQACELLKETMEGDLPSLIALQDALADLLLSGNAIWLKRRSPASGRVSLIACNPDATQIETRANGEVEYRVYPDDLYHGSQLTASYGDVLIARGPRIAGRMYRHPRARFMSPPPVQTLARAILLAINSEDYSARFFDRKGGSVKSDLAIEFLQSMTPEQAEQFNDSLQFYMEGRNPLILNGAVKLHQLSMTPQDANLHALREFSTLEACRIFGVPASLVFQSEGQVFGGSITALSRAFVLYGLRLHVENLLSPLSFHCLPRGERFEIDYGRVTRGDLENLAHVLPQLRPTSGAPDGIFSRQELRSMAGTDEEYVNDWMPVENYMKNANGEAGE